LLILAGCMLLLLPLVGLLGSEVEYLLMTEGLLLRDQLCLSYSESLAFHSDFLLPDKELLLAPRVALSSPLLLLLLLLLLFLVVVVVVLLLGRVWGDDINAVVGSRYRPPMSWRRVAVELSSCFFFEGAFLLHHCPFWSETANLLYPRRYPRRIGESGHWLHLWIDCGCGRAVCVVDSNARNF